MVLVFILLGIIIFLFIGLTVFFLSTLQIEIINLKIGNKEINQNRIRDKYEIKIIIKFLDKIPILCFRLDNVKVNKIFNSEQLRNIDFNSMKKDIKIDKDIIEIIKNIKLKLVNLNLKIYLGTEDAVLTSYLVAFIASTIGIIIPHLLNKTEDCQYIVNPIYQNKNEYYVSLDSIISIKIVHIINSMLIFVKKGRDKNERTSNRRSYAYSYE